jgi:hypothetical protein
MSDLFPSLYFAKISPRKSPLTRSTIEPGELREHLRDVFATDRIHIEDDSEAPFSTWSNQEKMLHKISVCHGMARNSGVNYDLMLRLRPDKFYRVPAAVDWHNVAYESARSRKIFIDVGKYIRGQFSPAIGDQIAAGCPEVMDVLAYALEHQRQLIGKGYFMTPHAFIPHENLAVTLLYHQIDVERLAGLPVTLGELANPRELTANEVEQIIEHDCSQRQPHELDDALRKAIALDISGS